MSSESHGPCADLSDKKENEKKKRSRVKQLLADVKKLVEFWFGDANLHKDRFMKTVISESRDGYMDISVLTSFNRMKSLTTDVKLIARALKNSTLVEVNHEGTRVRRKTPLGECQKDVDSCTVYVELLPKTVNHVWLERVFSKCGKVVYISIPRYKSTRDPKGFAFVEFETEEQAQKAIEMLNNPPEDAPNKPGIFPKTLSKKAIPFDAITQEDEAGKKKKMKRSQSDPQNSTSVETVMKKIEEERTLPALGEPNTDVLPSTGKKKTSKKRRRSQCSEASGVEAQCEVPAKVKKENDETSIENNTKDLLLETKTEDVSDAMDKTDGSGLKAKRKRKKKIKERLKAGEEVIPLRVLSKKEWLNLKQEYMTLQKRCMARLKQTVAEVNSQLKESEACKETAKRAPPSGPEFVSGVIIKISYNQPLPSRKCIKDVLLELSPVAYVDIVDGDVEGHVRFKSPEDAQKVIKARTELQKKVNWNLELLTGDHEERYWQKILVDRQAKLNTPREKRRGTEKLISKAEKILIAQAKEASKHIHFDV
ncbi:hypothetical protein DNTS_026759 [Danionella cerebrum]|uniref:La-related protein 7 n=1 Tax=Danionella cerebrum TaxID=2873325 RepID=A0A553R1W9_9TELE|nr:hypothetical protein DNTS_026759 [Danionella translucida]